ncbi:MAG: FAD-binding oxidoreductase [Steroidobacteraceae bacterium]
MVLPAGVSQTNFSSAIRQFQEAVGRQWVFTSDEDVHLYRDAYSPYWGEKEELLPSAALAPDSVEQVQTIVRIANQYKIPLYPISTGMNLTYGGSAPTYSGSVMVDLKRMNRILDVNIDGATCLVEPGVSYFDMYRYLRENKIPLWIDCPDPGWGSLLGNALDRGVGQTMGDFRFHFDAHCGMEVVMANGDVVRTGMGANPVAETWQQYKYGMGPWVDGIFSQSNFGIVTKMGFWLMPEPEGALQVTIEAPKREDIHAFVAIQARLMYLNIIPSRGMIVSPIVGGSMNPELYALRTKPGGASSAEWDRYAQSKGRPFWRSTVTYYGTRKMIEAQWEHTKEQFSVIPGVKFTENAWYKFPLTDEQVDQVSTSKAMLGIPSLTVFATRSDADSPPRQTHNDFSPMVPRTGAAFLQALDVCAQVFAKYGFEFLGNIGARESGRCLNVLHEVIFTKDPEQNKKARALFAELVDVCGQHGWGDYRVHPFWQEKAMSYYSFDNHSLHRLHETLKDAVDPNGILSPGRYGIWGKRLREARR